MQNTETWTSTKFEFVGERLRGSRNQKFLNPGSRIIADLVALAYQDGIPKHASGRLLDLGCGHCPLYETYRGFVDEVICVDWAETLHENEFLDFQADLTKKLPIEDNTFDTILLSDVLEHLPCPESTWKEMHRILKPSGKLVLNTPFFYRLHEKPHDYYRYTKFALERFATENGFLVLELNALGGAPEVIFDITGKTIGMLGQLGRLQKPFVILAQFFLWTGLLKRISERTVEDFPLGYFMVVQKPSV